MFADPTLLRQTTPDTERFDRQAFLNALRRGAVLPALSAATAESDRTFLLEYADFLREQEACYCQQ
jgi:hypothetical protein